MTRMVKTFVGFILISLVACGFAWYHSVTPATSLETGAWALRFRIVEIFFLAVTAGSVLLLVEQIQVLLVQTKAASEAANKQLEQTNRWNRRRSYHEFFPELPTAQSRKAFSELAERLQIDDHERGEPLLPATCTVLMEPANKRVVLDYLNDFEEFAGAVRRELVENQYAYDLESQRISRVWTVFAPFITTMRTLTVYADAYTELEALANQWSTRTVNARGGSVVTPT